MDIREKIEIEREVKKGNFQTLNPEDKRLLKEAFYTAYTRDCYPGPNGIGFAVKEKVFDIFLSGDRTATVRVVGTGPGIDAVGGGREFKGWDWRWTFVK